MRTSAFIARVAVCGLLSLIPLTELDNTLFSARMVIRGNRPVPPNLLIVEVPSDRFDNAAELARIEGQLIARGAAASWVAAGRKGFAVDSDGVVRRAVLAPHSGAGSPTLSVSRKLGIDPESFRKPFEPHLINFVGRAGRISHCAYDAELAACGDLHGKIALIGESGSAPLRTPLGDMGYAEVLANDIHTVVDHRPIYQASIAEQLLLVLAMILLTSFYIMYYPVIIGASAIIGSGALVAGILLQIIFMLFDVYIPAASIALSILVTYLIFTGYRLAFQENLQWRSLKQAQYLRELDEMKTNFLSLVSHDLKTPLAKIQAVIERFRREFELPVDERGDWKGLLDSMENSNNELKNYITSILNLSRIESQKVIVNKKTNDVNALIQQTLKRIRRLAKLKQITVEEQLEPLFAIECDEDLVRQILTNLIDNAIKYSPAGAKIIVRSREEEGFVRVDVQDFGPGIPPDQLPLMFRKFNRFVRPMADQGAAGAVKGSGLGLYLSKYFIELHGGKILLQSVEGQGTTFTFTLPLQS